jgi:DNA replicative helicase MCM subunit Mcm2 (Cdc46/Mcm family)
MRGFIVKA